MTRLCWTGALLLAVACGGKDTIEGDPVNGAVVFADGCASCHGGDGTGGVGPSLYTVVPELTDGELVSVMVDGVGEMPAIALEGNEPADVRAYLRETFGPYAGDADTADDTGS